MLRRERHDRQRTLPQYICHKSLDARYMDKDKGEFCIFCCISLQDKSILMTNAFLYFYSEMLMFVLNVAENIYLKLN
jgi:hypothetical protein